MNTETHSEKHMLPRRILYRLLAVFALLAGLMALAACGSGDPYENILRYTSMKGENDPALKAIDAEIERATLADHPVIEDKLLKAIQSPRATLDCKSVLTQRLKTVASEKSVPVLMELLENRETAPAARRILRESSSLRVDALLRRELSRSRGEALTGVIGVVGDRGDKEAIPLLWEKTNEPEPSVRAAAYRALGKLVEPDQAPRLVASLVESESDAVREALQEAVVSAASREENREERVVPILSAYASAPSKAKAALLRAAGKLGGGLSVAHLTRALRDPERALKEAALQGLYACPDPQASGVLLNFAQTTESEELAELARGAYLLKAGESEGREPEERLAMYRKVAPLLKGNETESLIEGLGDIGTAASLEMTLSYLDDPAFQTAACRAVIKHGEKLAPSHREVYIEALKKAADVCRDPKVRAETEAALRQARAATETTGSEKQSRTQ